MFRQAQHESQAHRGSLKTKIGGKHENQPEGFWTKYLQIAQKRLNSLAFVPKRQRTQNIQG